VGDLQYDDYDLATYFPQWISRTGDTSYLEIVTDTVRDVENERYIVTPGAFTTNRGVQFNPIPVTFGDVINFSLQFRTDDSTPTYSFYVRFLLVRGDGQVRALNNNGTWSAP